MTINFRKLKPKSAHEKFFKKKIIKIYNKILKNLKIY